MAAGGAARIPAPPPVGPPAERRRRARAGGRIVAGVDTGTCDSCGDPERDDLVALHRLYVIPEDWDTEGKVARVEEVERWCVPCRTHYPHEVVEPGEPG